MKDHTAAACKNCAHQNGADFSCNDCAVDTSEIGEYYMVLDDIWHESGVPERRMLCIGCLEHRLGRKLNYLDFSDAPLNWMPFPRSDRLQDRLAGHPLAAESIL